MKYLIVGQEFHQIEELTSDILQGYEDGIVQILKFSEGDFYEYFQPTATDPIRWMKVDSYIIPEFDDSIDRRGD